MVNHSLCLGMGLPLAEPGGTEPGGKLKFQWLIWSNRLTRLQIDIA